MLEAFIKMLYEYRNRMGLLIGEYSLKNCSNILTARETLSPCAAMRTCRKRFTLHGWIM